MRQSAIIKKIKLELKKAKEKHPYFPSDRVHQVAIMAEESGEAVRAVLNNRYEQGSESEIKRELAQTAAMCIRIMEGM